MQLNKLILEENKEKKLVNCFKNKMSQKDFCMFLTFSKIFCSSSKDALIYVDSWFLMISETDNFLQLEINLLEEVISRSNLLVTSEIEVYQAVDKWINYNFFEREKFSKSLLHKIRLPLLAEKTLKTILTEINCFRENKDSLAVINDILKGNFDFYRNKSIKFFSARYCSHDTFDVLYFGGYDIIKKFGSDTVNSDILQVQHSDDFNSSEVISSLRKKRYDSKVVHIKGNVYVFSGFVEEVEMYSHLTKTCKPVANIKVINKHDFCCYALCGFMDKIYLVGGYDGVDFERDTCIQFDTKDFSWKHKSKMQERRGDPASCVFEEKIIVSGGTQLADDDFVNFVNHYDYHGQQTLNTVEAYDPIDDTWTEFPTMNYSRCLHKSVVVKNKLFVIAGGTNINEVYDSTTKNFAILKPSLNLYDITSNHPFATFKVSHKLFVCFRGSSNIFCFDTTKGKWCEIPSKPTENLTFFSAIQIPRF